MLTTHSPNILLGCKRHTSHHTTLASHPPVDYITSPTAFFFPFPQFRSQLPPLIQYPTSSTTSTPISLNRNILTVKMSFQDKAQHQISQIDKEVREHMPRRLPSLLSINSQP